MRYADFELYRIKHGDKGHLGLFERQAYLQGGFMRNAFGALERLLKQRAVRYAYQPVLDA